MLIAICDDEKILYNELKEKIIKYQQSRFNAVDSIMYFETPSLLYDFMLNKDISDKPDIIFMDLKFKSSDEDGIDWSKKIIQYFPNILIIILTAYEERYKEGFVARAFRFMTKPVSDIELVESLDSCMLELKLTQTLSLNRRGIIHNIFIKDILYLSAQSGGSELWINDNVFYCDESLLQWEQKLPEFTFFRCHKKYLVNLGQVSHLENHMVTLLNNEKLPVSRRKWTALQLAYMRYDVKHY